MSPKLILTGRYFIDKRKPQKGRNQWCVCALFPHWVHHYYRLKNYKTSSMPELFYHGKLLYYCMWKNHTFIVTLVYCVPHIPNAYYIRITQLFACVSAAHVSEKSQYILSFYLALSLSLPTERTRNIEFVSIWVFLCM